jgi:hypothetical protein
LFAGEEVGGWGGTISDDWRESLALCLIWWGEEEI